MKIVALDNLQELLASDRPVRLVMTLGAHRFAQAHIPGSEFLGDLSTAEAVLDFDDEIVVYCSGPACHASARAQRALTSRGYRNVRRFAGGLEEWHAAGLPLASTSTQTAVAA